MSGYAYYEDYEWDNLSVEKQKEVINEMLLTFAKGMQQLIDDNPDLNEDLCGCSAGDPYTGMCDVTCDIHVLPWILRHVPKEKD